MPKAKYPKGQDGYYFINLPNGKLRKNGYPAMTKLRSKTCAGLDAKVEEFKKNQSSGVDTSKKNMTVDEWYSEWFRAYKSNTKPTTQEFYNNLYNVHIKPAIGSMPITAVKEVHIQPILSSMQDKSIRTVKSVKTVIVSLFDKARINNVITKNPCEKLTVKGKESKDRRALTIAERKQLLNSIDAQTKEGLFASILYFFGTRRGEALALKGTDFRDGRLHIERAISYPDNHKPILATTKTAKGQRSMPIPKRFSELIDVDSLPPGYLFTDNAVEFLTYSKVRTLWRRITKSAFPEGTDITQHTLRHNYCTMLFEAGVDLQTVKELAGHTDIKTTLSIYTHWSESLKISGEEKAVNIG